VFARAFRSKTVIVAFHRIRDDMPEDGLTCGSAKFEKFCEFFCRYFSVIPLSEQVAGCNAGKDMGGTLSITLDDGPLVPRRFQPVPYKALHSQPYRDGSGARDSGAIRV
jgi:hypothetical protein